MITVKPCLIPSGTKRDNILVGRIKWGIKFPKNFKMLYRNFLKISIKLEIFLAKKMRGRIK